MEPLSPEQEYQQMRAMLNEKQWRHYLAAEAQRRGSASTVAREAGVSLNTVKRGLREREAGETYEPGARIRRPGAGRKKLAHADPTLLTDLEQLAPAQGRPEESGALDHQVAGAPGPGARGPRPADQEISTGGTAPRA